jgi:hypothetical protein
MAYLKTTIGSAQIDMLDQLAARYGYEGKTARSDTVAYLIVEAWRRDGYSNRWGDIRAKAARVLSRIRNWPTPLLPTEIKAVGFKDGHVSVTTTLSGEPYSLRLKEWEE